MRYGLLFSYCELSERNRSRQIVELTLIARKPRRNDVGDVEAKSSVQNEANEFSNPLCRRSRCPG